MTLSRIIVFEDVIKVGSKVQSFWIIMSPKSNDECSYKRQERQREIKEEDHMKTEAEIEMTSI